MDNAIVKLCKLEDEDKTVTITASSDTILDVKQDTNPVVMLSRLDDDKLKYYSSTKWITVDIQQLDMNTLS